MPKPFFKFVGGKTQLLPQLLEICPKEFIQYHEPFLGGGALFFALQPHHAWLSDVNPRLVNAFRTLKDDPEGLIDRLSALVSIPTNQMRYLSIRDLMNCELDDAESSHPGHLLGSLGSSGCLGPLEAARFLFINKTSFNGLWRVNSSGAYNVPYGGDRVVRFDHDNLRACSSHLRSSNAYIMLEDFSAVEARAFEGDLVYFDPPYLPIKASSFVNYSDGGFRHHDHVRLRDLMTRLKSRGVNVIMSNSDTITTRELYKDFELIEVNARRNVNSDGKGRGYVKELIIR